MEGQKKEIHIFTWQSYPPHSVKFERIPSVFKFELNAIANAFNLIRVFLYYYYFIVLFSLNQTLAKKGFSGSGKLSNSPYDKDEHFFRLFLCLWLVASHQTYVLNYYKTIAVSSPPLKSAPIPITFKKKFQQNIFSN